jgi:hypothetical protein
VASSSTQPDQEIFDYSDPAERKDEPAGSNPDDSKPGPRYGPYPLVRWVLAIVIVGVVAVLSLFRLVPGEKPSCMATTATWTTTKAGAGANSTSTLARKACGLPDTSNYLYFALALAGLLLLPDIQSLKVGGVEVRRLSEKVAEQTKDITEQGSKIDYLRNQLVSVLHNDQVFSQILHVTPASTPHNGSPRSAERIAEGQADHPQLVRQRVIGQEQPKTLTARANLAQQIGEAGDAVRARDLYAALLPAMKRDLSPDNPETWNARAELAHWTGEAGHADEARDQYDALLKDTKRVAPSDPGIPALRANHAWYTGLAGDPARARDQYAELLDDMERADPSDPGIRAVRANRDYWTNEANQSSDIDSTGN